MPERILLWKGKVRSFFSEFQMKGSASKDVLTDVLHFDILREVVKWRLISSGT